MRTFGRIAALLVFSAPAWAEITVQPDDVRVGQAIGSFSALIPIQITNGPVTFGGYDIKIDILPGDGGLEYDFDPDEQAAIRQLGGSSAQPGYLFQSGSAGQFVSTNSTPISLYVDDYPAAFDGEIVQDGVYDLVAMNLVLPDPNIADGGPVVYDMDISKIGFFDEEGDPVATSVQTFNFQIEITADTPGDTDRDGDIDHLDYLAIKRGFGTADPEWENGDFDDDDDTDFDDYNVARNNYDLLNPPAPPAPGIAAAAAALPEPATLSLLALGAAALIRRRR